VIDDYLAQHPRLAIDLRQKVLQTRDELERTVRIRAAQRLSSQRASSAPRR